MSAEVESLSKLKASKMKELVMKRRSELEDLCRITHIQPDTSTSAEKSSALIDSGIKKVIELFGFEPSCQYPFVLPCFFQG